MGVAHWEPQTVPVTLIEESSITPPRQSHHDHQTHQHEHEEAAPRSVGQPAPCWLFVADTESSEAAIAQEMQHHPSDNPAQSRAAAAHALMVRELLRLECERLAIAPTAGHDAADVEAVEKETHEEVRIRLLLESVIDTRTPDETACLRYYEQNRERFRAPDQCQLRHILFAAAPDDAAGRMAARAQAEQHIAELQINPVLFADFALRQSSCPSREQGGELGWLQRGQTTPEFDRQVFRLPVGLAAFPVESRWGYHVVDVLAQAAGEALTFDAVHAQIAHYLELQVQQSELQHYLQGLQERYGVRGLEQFDY